MNEKHTNLFYKPIDIVKSQRKKQKGAVTLEFMIKRTSIWMRSKITSYLKQHNLYFETDLMEGIPRITMVFKNCDRCPDYITEGCIWFYEDFMEVRVYYSKLGAEICQKSKYLFELYRLLNYINARLWVSVSDGLEGALYQSQYLIQQQCLFHIRILNGIYWRWKILLQRRSLAC